MSISHSMKLVFATAMSEWERRGHGKCKACVEISILAPDHFPLEIMFVRMNTLKSKHGIISHCVAATSLDHIGRYRSGVLCASDPLCR